ncbi:hypothetical protein RZS08_03350, partial [Arthrospira platensis SPKY1]|nr:hypothetical protein [Arthrospira platensis SPKY1]
RSVEHRRLLVPTQGAQRQGEVLLEPQVVRIGPQLLLQKGFRLGEPVGHEEQLRQVPFRLEAGRIPHRQFLRSEHPGHRSPLQPLQGGSVDFYGVSVAPLVLEEHGQV